MQLLYCIFILIFKYHKMIRELLDTIEKATKDYPMTSQSESSDPLVCISYTQVHWWKYYIYEYDPQSHIAFWYVEWFESEFWSIDMLEQIEVAMTYNFNLDFTIQDKIPLSELSDFISLTSDDE